MSALIIFNGYLEFKEMSALREYLSQIPNVDSESDRNAAILVSNKVRSDFNVDKKTWKNLSKRKEPYLKYSALNLLKWKEGHCGKGTRLLVLLLKKLGMDATRITLYGEDLKNKSAHTLVSVIIDGEEHLIDSVNSSETWNEQLKTKRVSARSLFLDSQEKGDHTSLEHNYVNYSYEAYPTVMISKGLKLENIIFNHKRPPAIISWIMESVYLQKCIFYSGIVFLIWCVRMYFKKRHQVKLVEVV